MAIITGHDKAFTFTFIVGTGVTFAKGDRYLLDSDGYAIKPTGATDKTLGVTLEDRSEGQPIACTVPGMVIQAKSTGAIAPMDYVGLGSSSYQNKIQKITTAGSGTTEVQTIGIAISKAAGAGVDTRYTQVPNFALT